MQNKFTVGQKVTARIFIQSIEVDRVAHIKRIDDAKICSFRYLVTLESKNNTPLNDIWTSESRVRILEV